MIAFADVISKVAELLQQVSYFGGENVIVSDGTEDPLVEKAMRERGFCVLIAPIMRAPKKDAGAAMTIVRAEIFIIVQVNPKVNKTSAQKDIYVAVQEIVKKLKAYAPPNINDRFEVADDACDLSSFDPGLWAYDLTFTKSAVF